MGLGVKRVIVNLTTNEGDDKVSGRSREEKLSGELSETEGASHEFGKKNGFVRKAKLGLDKRERV